MRVLRWPNHPRTRSRRGSRRHSSGNPAANGHSVVERYSHALNRGNRHEAVFHEPGDYDAFVEAMIDARAVVPFDLLGSCPMPSHIHLLMRRNQDGGLGRWMRWRLTAHVRRYHCHYGDSGHVWQGRFKAFRAG